MTGRDVLTPDVARKIESGVGPILIVVTFDGAPPKAILDEFGLDAVSGDRATGPLQAGAIRRLAASPNVREIALVRGDGDETVPANPKLDASLSGMLFDEDRGDLLYEVAVTFKPLPPEETLQALGLRASAPGDVFAFGRLGKEAILELASREDVVYIKYQRPPEPAVR